jgi:uncharacterized membrane protein YphA (DoxX/SURF4 family)
MSLSAKARRASLRAVTGAFVLNSGVGKLSADEDTAKSLHGMAVGTYPVFGQIQPKVFAKGLAVGEIALGAALLLPVVPPLVAGGALAAFSGGLLNMYWHTPGMHEEGSPRPTQQGVPIAKDVWMFGIGTGLVADALLEPAHDKKVALEAGVAAKRAEKSRRAERKAAKAASARYLKQAREAARTLADEYGPIAAEKAKHAGKAARDLAEELGPVASEKAKHVRKVAHDVADEYGPVAAQKAKEVRKAADEYGALAAEKAKHVRKAAREAADEYGPVAAQKAKDVRKAADEYGALAAEKAKQAQQAAKDAGVKARERVAS